jgi:membrane protein DedA with SNARE-associated domain
LNIRRIALWSVILVLATAGFGVFDDVSAATDRTLLRVALVLVLALVGLIAIFWFLATR